MRGLEGLGGSMEEKREHHRIRCESRCLLYYEQTRFCGVIQDISLSGAGVRLLGKKAGRIRPGDTCSLILGSDTSMGFCNYTGRIIRVGPFLLGLEFVNRRP